MGTVESILTHDSIEHLQLNERLATNLKRVRTSRSAGFPALLQLMTLYRVVDVLAFTDDFRPGRVPKINKLPGILRGYNQASLDSSKPSSIATNTINSR